MPSPQLLCDACSKRYADCRCVLTTNQDRLKRDAEIRAIKTQSLSPSPIDSKPQMARLSVTLPVELIKFLRLHCHLEQYGGSVSKLARDMLTSYGKRPVSLQGQYSNQTARIEFQLPKAVIARIKRQSKVGQCTVSQMVLKLLTESTEGVEDDSHVYRQSPKKAKSYA